MSITAADISAFRLTPDTGLSRNDVLEHGVVVEDIDWDMVVDGKDPGSLHEDIALKRLAAAGVPNPFDFVKVGTRTLDLSGWDDFEGKYEYLYKVTYLVVPKRVLDACQVDFTYEDAAADVGFSEYAGPLSHWRPEPGSFFGISG